MKFSFILTLMISSLSLSARAETISCLGTGNITLADGEVEFSNVAYALEMEVEVEDGRVKKSETSPSLILTLENGFKAAMFFDVVIFSHAPGAKLEVVGQKDPSAFLFVGAFDAKTGKYAGELKGRGARDRSLSAVLACSVL